MILLLLICGGAVCYTRLTGSVDADTLKTMLLERIARQQRAATPLEQSITASLQSSRAGKIAFQNYYGNTINEQPDRWLYQLILIGQTATLFDANLPAFYPQTKICYLRTDMISLDAQAAMTLYAYTQKDRKFAKAILDQLPYDGDHPYKVNLAAQLLRQAAVNDDAAFVVYAINNSHPDFWQRTGSLLFYTPMLMFMVIKKYLFGWWAVFAAAVAVKLMTCLYKNTVNTAKNNGQGGPHG